MDLLVPEDEKRYRILAERTKFTSLSTLETPLAGSKWDLPEILTFRVLRNKGTSDYPQFLSLFYHDATTTLNDWEDFRNLVDILRERDWANSSRTKLRRIGKDFGPFLSHLAEVIEEKPLARKLPTMTTRQSARVSNMNDKAPEATLPDKKEELDVSRASDEDQSSGSSEATASSFENQPTLAQQVKTETVPNALIIEYLQSLAMCICESDDQRNFCLEWSTNQDNLQFPIPKGKFVKTRNDGGLVNRSIAPRGNWTRVLPLTCYCSIEASFSAFASLQISVLNDFLKAKAVHVVEAKKREVYAQEASQMIGMIHQREENAGHAGLSKEYATSQRFK